MSYRQKLKRFYMDHSPIVRNRRNKLRENLINTTPSFLCPDCMGGHLFHDLGLQFRSPTVNLMFLQTDFYEFVMHLEEYLNGTLIFFKHETYTFPCAHLHADGLDDITVHFTHYTSEEDALEKWRERSKRIDMQNLFLVIEERDGLTESQLRSLGDIPVRGLLAFTANRYEDIPYALQLKHCEPCGEVQGILKERLIDGSWAYERYFDFVKWFNEADGNDYDISPFVKKPR